MNQIMDIKMVIILLEMENLNMNVILKLWEIIEIITTKINIQNHI